MYVQIGGEHLDRGYDMLPVLNPVTGTVIDHVPSLTDADIKRAVEEAVEGQKEWAAKTQSERNRILRKFAGIMITRRAKIGALLCSENGKRIVEAEEEVEQ